jgi:5-methylcytosine-specific restriction endonuclease McrA
LSSINASINTRVQRWRIRCIAATNRLAETISSGHFTRRSWHRIRELVNRRDNGVCQCCGEHCPETGHVDHIIPLSRGGDDKLDNLVWACEKCNLSKGNRTLSEWQPTSAAACHRGGCTRLGQRGDTERIGAHWG